MGRGVPRVRFRARAPAFGLAQAPTGQRPARFVTITPGADGARPRRRSSRFDDRGCPTSSDVGTGGASITRPSPRGSRSPCSRPVFRPLKRSGTHAIRGSSSLTPGETQGRNPGPKPRAETHLAGSDGPKSRGGSWRSHPAPTGQGPAGFHFPRATLTGRARHARPPPTSPRAPRRRPCPTPRSGGSSGAWRSRPGAGRHSASPPSSTRRRPAC